MRRRLAMLLAFAGLLALAVSGCGAPGSHPRHAKLYVRHRTLPGINSTWIRLRSANVAGFMQRPRAHAAPRLAPHRRNSPQLVRDPHVGQILTTSNGTWTGSNLRFGYQWQDCDAAGATNCANIPAATGVTYTVAVGDVGHTIRSAVTATNAGGSVVSYSAATTATVSAPANTGLPTISGTTTSGQVLTATTGTWNYVPTSYAYQWQQCNSSGASCVNALGSGATTATYTLAVGDATHTIRVTVTATNATGSTAAQSMQTVVIAAAGGGGSNIAPTLTLAGGTISWSADANATSFTGITLGSTANATVSRAAGFPVETFGFPATTLSVTPHAVGDAIIVGIATAGTGGGTQPSGVTCTCAGGGFTKIQGYTDTPQNQTVSAWWGIVTSTSTANVTVAGISGSPNVDINADDLVSSLSSPSWGVDVSGTLHTIGSSPYPTLTPTKNATEAYWGIEASSDGAVAGTTTGFTYTQNSDANQVIWDPTVASGTAYAPAGGGGGLNDTIGIVFYATASTASSTVSLGNVTSWTPSVAPGQTLTFQVASEGAAGQKVSGNSETITGGASTQFTLAQSGTSIFWSPVAGATDYTGAISNDTRANASRTTTYVDIGNVSSWGPPVACGQTLYYGVGSNAPGVAWSTNEVSITWPACQGAASSFIMGVNDGVGWGTAVAQDTYNCAAALGNSSGTGGNDTHGDWCPSGVVSGNNVGFHWDRIDASAAGYPSGTLVNTALSAGWNVLVVLDSTDATTDVNIMNSYKSFGARVMFEFTNEPNLGTTGVTMTAAQYAAAYQTARNAKIAAGITQPLLFYTMGSQDGGTDNNTSNPCNSSTMWIADAVCAVPSLQVDGLAVHPYGQDAGNTGGNSYGIAALKAQHDFTVTNYPQFANAQWYLTEYGFTLNPFSSGHSDTGCAATTWYVPTYAQQEAQAWTSYSDLITLPWVGGVWWYQTHDDSSGWFGLVTSPSPQSVDCSSEGTGNDGAAGGSPTPFNPRPILANTDSHTLGDVINTLRLASRLG